jgi:signal peptidase II
MKVYRYFFLALLVILIDQTSKLLIHHYMDLHEEITVIGDDQHGFKLHYLLNPGMAFGIRWKSEFGKLALTVFRILAMIGIAYYLWKMAKRKAHAGFLWCMALILGGAVGNVIDSTFYGVLLQNHPPDSPTPWFHGQVIDMLYFPLFEFTLPYWVPFKGGEYFTFFSPVFNIADSSIFIGVVFILLFQKKFFKEHVVGETKSIEPPSPAETTESVIPDQIQSNPATPPSDTSNS